MPAVIKRSFLHGLSLVLQRISLNWMRLGLMGIDAVIFNACLILALWLRFDGAIPADYWAVYYRHALWFTALFLLVSFRLGLYNRIWKYASADAALVIALSVSVTVVLGVAICMFLGGDQFPRGVLAMLWGFTLLFVGVSRFGWRAARSSFGKTNGYTNGERRRLLIYGAGESGVLLAREARQDPHSMYDVVGFMDDSRKLKGMVVSGFRVLGTSQDFETIVQKYEVQEVIVAQKSVGVAQLSDVVEAGKTLGVKVRRVPSLLEMVDGEAGLPRVRDIEVSDLIGRNPVCPDLDLKEDYIHGRTILVTGAGGSIGSEICRQLCRYQPGRVVLLGRGENRIHSVYYELREKFPGIQFDPVICNITESDAVEDTLARYRPEVIFHAAAHKHVFLMECNPVEAARNNVLGTTILADLSEMYGVERFIMISTDKATEPTCVMGATKALCERVVAQKNSSPTATRFITVRFGNVLGSAGSVVPIFKSLAAAGKPITVTDPEADRFFMTIEEASFLVLQAGGLGDGGETFVLDMGKPIRIVDIARTILRMHDRNPDEAGALRFIGLRPGEKLHETLVNPHEELVETACDRLRKVKTNGNVPSYMSVAEALETLHYAVRDCDNHRVLETLRRATQAQFAEGTLAAFERRQATVGIYAA